MVARGSRGIGRPGESGEEIKGKSVVIKQTQGCKVQHKKYSQ